MMIVSKAPVVASRPRKKPLSNSQEVLFTLLRKRFQRYVAAQAKSGDKDQLRNERTDIQECSPVKNDQPPKNISHGRQTVAKRTTACTQLRYRKRNEEPLNNTFIEMGCKELAEHVVDQAKGRLARRPKKVVHKLPTTPKHGSIPRNSNSNPPSSMITHRDMTTISSRTGDNSCVSPLKCKLVTVCSLANSSNFPKISQSSTSLIQSKTSLIQLKTIYLSEKHSSTPKDTRIPNVPPSTPDSIFSCSHNYILSLNDIKSQRHLKSQLQALCALQARQEAAAHKESELEEKRKQKQEIARLKARQRAEIYALNGIMREFEEQKFREFISGKV